MSKYIVSIGRTIKECTELINNGEINLTDEEIILNFVVEEDTFEKKMDIGEIKNKRIKINYVFNDVLMLISMGYNLEEFFIKFDENSKSAYNSLKTELNNLNKITGVLYYESGNIRMTGEFILDEESNRYSANGDAIVYYDKSDENVMYCGEIENENYDGSGVFTNIDANITLKINNIDKNTPIGKGMLNINDYFGEKYYSKEINFDEIDEIDLIDIDLNEFINSHTSDIFKDLLDYSVFTEKYEMNKNTQRQFNEIRSASQSKQIELLFNKQLEFEMKLDSMMGKINFIFDKLNTQKKSGFLW